MPEETRADETVIRDPAGGVNHAGLRDHNERLVLSLVQRHGQLPSAEIARRAGLSPQTVSIIARRLEADGLLLRRPAIRGKVGKPSIPLALDPNGVLSLGLKIGRRSVDLALVDFTGALRTRREATYAYPEPDFVLDFAQAALKEVLQDLALAERRRVAGIGIAAPFELWKWLPSVNAPPEKMRRWSEIDLAAEVARLTGLPAVSENDATAACTAEHHLGLGRGLADYAYFFIGAFVGGGVVLDDRVYPGRMGNAGAFGSLPVPDGKSGTTQLLHRASIYRLERALEAGGHDASVLWRSPDDWSGFPDELDAWIRETGAQLALASVAVSAVIDFGAVLIDGACPRGVRARIVAEAQEALAGVNTEGIVPPLVLEGSIGRDARSIGAATLPILSGYMLGGGRSFR